MNKITFCEEFSMKDMNGQKERTNRIRFSPKYFSWLEGQKQVSIAPYLQQNLSTEFSDTNGVLLVHLSNWTYDETWQKPVCLEWQ